ncbi:asparaginase domain-containing protein [Pareuzebyella sediminis]|uniref:asparaginase domain-containing protein n=1 Tax=Pareuzebyella sediminis TaxID=2607998 RepID=UPI0011EEB6A6|nr:asparaginase domain-containing protein [Pareuzebyella sediminis]
MIQIFTTGGTIEGFDYQVSTQKQSNTKSIEDLIGGIIPKAEYSIEKLFDKDSRFITQEERALIGEKITASSLSKILLTHGTITMVETARFLGQLNLDKTIVLTGAFVLGTEPDTDAPVNLGYALSALGFLEEGVFIAMNGKIFPWNNVRKNIKKNRFEYASE